MGNKGLQHLARAAVFSLAGLKAALRHETAFRQELVLFFVLAPVGLWLGETGAERALLVGSISLVLVIELLNSAIEAVVDRFGTKPHTLAGRAKDLGAAAVFCAILSAVVIWVLVLLN